MKKLIKHVIWTVVVTLLILMAIPLIVIASGVINVAATNPPGDFEKRVATWSLSRSIDIRAPSETNPFADDAAAISTGLRHFREMCLQCHGAPGIKPDEFATGLNPPAPELSGVVEEWSDGELYWIVKHGIRLTGMPGFGPTHHDDDIWKMVAFVRQLPDLNNEQRETLRERASSGHAHGHGGEDQAPSRTTHEESGDSSQEDGRSDEDQDHQDLPDR